MLQTEPAEIQWSRSRTEGGEWIARQVGDWTYPQLVMHVEPGQPVVAEWQGPTWKPISIDWHCVQNGWLPSFPLRQVDEELWMGSTVYARVDGWRFFTWAYWRARARVLHIKCRVLGQLYRAAHRTGRFHPPQGEVMSLRALWRSWRAP